MAHGNKDWASKEEWEKMKEEGLATKTDKGWKLNTSFEEAKAHLSKKEPSVSPLTNPTTAEPITQTTANATPKKTPSDMETPSGKNIPNSSINAEGSQPINRQIDTAFRENLANNSDALKNAQTIRDNKLNHATTEGAKAKANAEYEATRQKLGGGDFHPGSPEMPHEPKGRFAKAFEAFGEAYSHSSKSTAFAAGSIAAASVLFATQADASSSLPAVSKGVSCIPANS